MVGFIEIGHEFTSLAVFKSKKKMFLYDFALFFQQESCFKGD